MTVGFFLRGDITMLRTRFTLLTLLTSALFTLSCGSPDEGPAVLTGLVNATEIDVASKVPGRVNQLLVREGDRVRKDQRLLTLESQQVLAKVRQVQAAVNAAQAQLKLARRGARKEQRLVARRALDATRYQNTLAHKMYLRAAKLREADAMPQARYDEALLKDNLSKEQLAMAEARYQMVLKGARKEELEALGAQVSRGQGSLQEVQSLSDELVQTAPIAGEVSKIIVHRGELAATGFPILTLVETAHPWAAFAVREDLLQEIRKGTLIRPLVPALGRVVPMRITHIAPMGDFATWRATSEKNAFDLKTFEVQARPLQPTDGLRPGMTVRWTVED